MLPPLPRQKTNLSLPLSAVTFSVIFVFIQVVAIVSPALAGHSTGGQHLITARLVRNKHRARPCSIAFALVGNNKQCAKGKAWVGFQQPGDLRQSAKRELTLV